MVDWLFCLVTAICVSNGFSLFQTNTDLVRIIAYDYNAKGHRVVYVEQRGQNEEPNAKYLYSPIHHPVAAPKQVITPARTNVVDVPAPGAPQPAPLAPQANLPPGNHFVMPHGVPMHNALAGAAMHSPNLQLQPVPNILPVPAMPPPLAVQPRPLNMMPGMKQSPLLPIPQPARQPLLARAPYMPLPPHGLFKRQALNLTPGTLMSPPVQCRQVYAVPSTAQTITSRDTDLFACEILSLVMTGTFKVTNDNNVFCFQNYDAIKFEGKFAHTSLCE